MRPWHIPMTGRDPDELDLAIPVWAERSGRQRQLAGWQAFESMVESPAAPDRAVRQPLA